MIEQLSITEKLGVACLLVLLAVVIWLLGKLFPRKHFVSAGNALMHAETFFRPSRQHVIQAKQQEPVEQEESGDPPPAPHE